MPSNNPTSESRYSARWEMTGNRTYTLFINQKKQCELSLNVWHTQATLSREGKSYQLKRKGFMGMQMQLRDEYNQLLLDIPPGSLFTSSRRFICGKGSFDLRWKMRPSQTWSIEQFGLELISYQAQLATSKVRLIITDNCELSNESWMFHALLFYTSRAFQHIPKSYTLPVS
jgi:hypothetical protein